MQTERLRRITKSLISLTTLPTQIAQLFELVDEKDQREALERIVSSDPVLAARLLKMVNARGESVTGVHSAISKLGFEQTKDICMEASISRVFELKNSNIDVQEFWDHGNAVGVAARIIAQEYKPDLAEDAHIAGLLHDIGKIILLQYEGAEFEKAIALSKSRSCELYLVEKELFGDDHGQVGARLAESWLLPRSIGEVIMYHHNFARAEINRPLVALVSFANILCRILSTKPGISGNYAPPAFSEELAEELCSWGVNLDANALRPLMIKCIEELHKRGLAQYG
ncbi:MAG: HDOD domain-containing protein [Fibromonadales bacterium]|nr:HDOD domain-containing protein [Fibromonadales bacterium]